MRAHVVLILCVGAVLAQNKADQVFLKRQLQVLKLLYHIEEPVQDAELQEIKNSYSPLDNLDGYKDQQRVKKYVEDVKDGNMLDRDEIFSLFDPVHRGQMVNLFEVLYGANDYDTFFNTAVWARDRTNPRQFLYAFSVSLLHRKDARGLMLPPPYEITPHMFLTTDVVRKAYQAKMTRTPIVIPMKFTGSVNNPEQRVAYFGEDIGINSCHQHWHMDFPFWWKKSYNNEKDRKGELFFYMHHQMVARFDAERLSNDLPVVEPLDFDEEIVEGFAPAAIYHNGQEFPVRPDNIRFSDLPYRTVQEMKLYEGRIRDAIAAGFIRARDGLVYLNDTRGINLLGEIVESSEHSLNRVYYGQLHNDAHVMLSKVTDPQLKYGIPPGVMEHFETATRDPVFFRLHKHIDNLFRLHKDLLPPYNVDEVEFPGVTVEAVKVVGQSKASVPNKLITYFDESHIDLRNAVRGAGQGEVSIKAVVSRLNHEPFKYVISIRSDQRRTAVVRIFLAPKYDWFGQETPLNVARWGFIELDRFPVKLSPGDNVISRNDEDSIVSIPEPKSLPELLNEVEQAIKGEEEFVVDKNHRHCGFPHRLLLPKGKQEGMVYRLYVVVSDYDKDVVNPDIKPEDVESLPSLGYCGVLEGNIPDGRPMGYPFDRPIASPERFLTPNIRAIDVTITNVK